MSSYSLPPQAKYLARLFEALHREPPEAETTLIAVNKVLEVCPPHASLAANLESFFAAYDTLTAWHVATNNTQTSIGANLTSALSYLFADWLPQTSDVLPYLEKLGLYYSALTNETSSDPFVNFVAPNRAQGILRLVSAYRIKKSNLEAIKTHLPRTKEWDLSPRAAAQYRDQAEALARHIVTYRAYGVKPCVVRDGVVTKARHAWVINDGYDEVQLQPEQYRVGHVTPIAYIHLAEYDQVHDTSREIHRYGDHGTYSLCVNYPVLMHFNLRPDGKLAAEYVMGLLPLEEQFAAAGRPELFPLFWLTQLLRISDLVIPQYAAAKHKVPDWPTQAIGRKDRERQAKEMPHLLPKLWLPRIKALQDSKAMVTGIQNERKQDSETTQRITRKPPESIVGHFFRLRPGYEAQPAAIAESIARFGYPPPPGHSFRKKDGRSSGHEVRRRA